MSGLLGIVLYCINLFHEDEVFTQEVPWQVTDEETKKSWNVKTHHSYFKTSTEYERIRAENKHYDETCCRFDAILMKISWRVFLSHERMNALLSHALFAYVVFVLLWQMAALVGSSPCGVRTPNNVQWTGNANWKYKNDRKTDWAVPYLPR